MIPLCAAPEAHVSLSALAQANRQQIISSFASVFSSSSSSKTAPTFLYLRGLPESDFVRKWTDTELKFRQESFFLHASSLNKPDFHLLIEVQSAQDYRTIIAAPQLSADHALWCGPSPSNDQLKKTYAVEEVIPATPESILARVKNANVHVLDKIEFLPGTSPEDVKKHGIMLDDTLLRRALTKARLVKTEPEIAIIRYASQISALAHRSVFEHAALFKNEREVDAHLTYEFSRRGGIHLAYSSIVGAGSNAAVLHYGQNDAPIRESDWILVDAGCEVLGYAADITRTYPAKVHRGDPTYEKWTAVYRAVLDANKQVIASIRPGVKYEDLHILSMRVIARHLKKIGLLTADTEPETCDTDLVAVFYPHGLGHSIGLDVHDVGGYPDGVPRIQKDGLKYLRMRRTLEANNVVTVEPGLYFVPILLERARARPELSKHINWSLVEEYTRANIGGVRIEDDVLVTTDGCEVLSKDVPKELEEVEALVQKSWESVKN